MTRTRVTKRKEDNRMVTAVTTIEWVEVMRAVAGLLGDLAEDILEGVMDTALIGLAVIGIGYLLDSPKAVSVVLGLVPMTVVTGWYVADDIHGFFRYRHWEVGWTSYSYNP